MAKIESYFPSIYKIHKIKDFYTLGEAEDKLFEVASFELKRQLDNQFILTADEEGITFFELMAKIRVDPIRESLAFRRERLLQWVSLDVAYTLRFLKRQLTQICGEGNYTIEQNYDAYTLYVDTVLSSIQFQQLRVLFTRIMPCNIVWRVERTVTTPLLEEKLRATLYTRSTHMNIGDIEPYRDNRIKLWKATITTRSKNTRIGDE